MAKVTGAISLSFAGVFGDLVVFEDRSYPEFRAATASPR